jgi:hypothetical protein
VFGSHWRAGTGVVGVPRQPLAGGGGGDGGGVGGVPRQSADGGGRGAGAGAGAGVVGVPCQPDDGGGGGGGGGAAAGGDGSDGDGGGAAPPYFVPETQQLCGTGAGTAFFSQHRGFGPCTPGFTYVNATQVGSFMQVDWHISGLGDGRSKLR